jgi:neutral amino acid transport system permease protein
MNNRSVNADAQRDTPGLCAAPATGGTVKNVNPLSLAPAKKTLMMLIIMVLSMFGVLAASPAMADEVGTEYSDQVVGNVRNEGTPLEGVRIILEGNGYYAETVTDAAGKWAIGVPEKGTYQVTLVEETLPEGIAVLEGGAQQEVSFGATGTVVKNFFIGAGERNPISFVDQLLTRIFDGLNFGLLLGLAAIGLSLVFGTTGLPNFAHGEMVTFGAVMALMLVSLNVPIWLAIPGAIALGALAGWGMDAGLWKPLRGRSIGLVQLMIVSIGLSLTARYLYQFFIGGGTAQLPYSSGTGEIPLFRTVSVGVVDLISMIVSLVVILGFAWWLLSTKIGKATRAVSDNAALAAASGIDVDKVVRVVWIAASAMAALAGILWAYFRPGIKWDMGTQILLFIFAAGVLGGLGTAFGALVGAIIVGVLIETSALFIPSDLKYVGALVVMIVILLFRPQGILGRKERIG